MLFNSLEYLFFLPIVFLIYWAIGYARLNDSLKLRMQNAFVVIASYIFYGWWDWRFLLLIAFTSLCSWLSGILIERTKTKINTVPAINRDKQDLNKNEESSAIRNDSTVTVPQSACMQASRQSDDPFRSTDTVSQSLSDDSSRKNADCINCEKNIISAKFWLWLNIIINLGILGGFKYYDFFVSEFGQMFGIDTSSLLLRVILPVGISFYTFQALSYSIDVYRGNIKPTKDIIAFFAFISFFPQLVAGPIERATNLLPQFLANRKFSYDQGVDGMRQILWGLFKKIVIADNCATYVNQVWADYANHSGSTLLLTAILFTFQIYGDFSGYSDIAIGTAKLFGIKLMRNFNNPYFSRDIAEFWRRWHISLTSWFRDYVYIPLGGSRPNVVEGGMLNVESKKKFIIARNTFIIFLVSGIWHGANWTYMAWGVYHVALFIPLVLLGRTKREQRVERITWRAVWSIVFTFVLVTIGWIIFRAPTVTDAWEYVGAMCSNGLWTMPYIGGVGRLAFTAIAIAVMMGADWILRNEQHGFALMALRSKWLRYAIYIVLVAMMLWNGNPGDTFIYFQF